MDTNKKLILLLVLVYAAYLYGWRIHFDAIGSRRKIVTWDKHKNVFAKWKVPDVVGSLSGPAKPIEPRKR